MEQTLVTPLTSSGSLLTRPTHARVIDRLIELSETGSALRVSLLMPTPAQEGARRYRIRTRNVLRTAGQGMREMNVEPRQSSAVLAGLWAELTESAERGGQGVGIFIGDDGQFAIDVAEPLPELVAIGTRCFVGPVLPSVAAEQRVHVLALSGEDIGLFEVGRSSITRIPLEGLPLGPLATMPRRGPDLHAFTADRGGPRTGVVFHGGSDVTEDNRRALLRYFRRVDQAVRHVLRGEDALLVLAGVGDTQALYRQVSRFYGLLPEGITGAVRDINEADIQQRAWHLAEPVFRQAASDALSRYEELVGTGLTASGIHDVAEAAAQGRVERLLLPADLSIWQPPEAVAFLDLDSSCPPVRLDAAVVQTVRHGGQVHHLDGEQPPAPVAAILRY